MDQVKSVIILRNGKVIEKPILEPCEKEDELVYEGKWCELRDHVVTQPTRKDTNSWKSK